MVINKIWDAVKLINGRYDIKKKHSDQRNI